MPPLAPEQIPALAAALIRLRGDTLSRIAEATGIRPANLSVWLRGKEQVISEKRLVGLLHYLGVEGGQLRADMLHLWQDGGSLEGSKAVLGALLDRCKPVWLFRDEQLGLAKTRFLLAGEVLVRVQVEPRVSSAVDLVDVLEVDRVITAPLPLAGVPTASREAARDALLALAERAATETGDDELLTGLLHVLSEDYAPQLASNTASPQGWQQLENALRVALKAGAAPGDIAKVVGDHYRPGGNPARGRKQDSI